MLFHCFNVFEAVTVFACSLCVWYETPQKCSVIQAAYGRSEKKWHTEKLEMERSVPFLLMEDQQVKKTQTFSEEIGYCFSICSLPSKDWKIVCFHKGHCCSDHEAGHQQKSFKSKEKLKSNCSEKQKENKTWSLKNFRQTRYKEKGKKTYGVQQCN